MHLWQERWTATINIDLAECTGHGEVNYYLTKFLTGHGYFGAYLPRMGKIYSPRYRYDDAAADYARYTFIACNRLVAECVQAEVTTIALGNITRKTLYSEEKRCHVANYVESVLRKKKEEMDQPLSQEE